MVHDDGVRETDENHRRCRRRDENLLSKKPQLIGRNWKTKRFSENRGKQIELGKWYSTNLADELTRG